MNTPHVVKPWYREPWPWILMAGPFIVVIAATYTAYLAMSSADGLVADDYYKQGLSVNRTIARSDYAQKLGVAVALHAAEGGFAITLSARDQSFVPPQSLIVTLSHPTLAGMDQTGVFERKGDTYTGKLRLPAAGHWIVLVEDAPKSWRLEGNVVLPASGETVIGGESADVRN
ncbi:MAG: FixH family protein [Rhodocyclaceae bacterium]|nr:FixH family protein [Rhodocyclaceae bacterium]